MRATLAARYAGNGKIALMAPSDVATMLDRSLDVIVLRGALDGEVRVWSWNDGKLVKSFPALPR